MDAQIRYISPIPQPVQSSQAQPCHQVAMSENPAHFPSQPVPVPHPADRPEEKKNDTVPPEVIARGVTKRDTKT